MAVTALAEAELEALDEAPPSPIELDAARLIADAVLRYQTGRRAGLRREWASTIAALVAMRHFKACADAAAADDKANGRAASAGLTAVDTEEFKARLAAVAAPLPWHVDDLFDAGVAACNDGSPAVVADTNRERPDDQASVIIACVVEAVNRAGGVAP